MKHAIITLVLVLILAITEVNFAQNTYILQPGEKNNQVVLELSNISTTEAATDIEVKLIRKSKNLKFISEEKILNNLAQTTQSEIPFSFDVEYNIGETNADTIEFLITDRAYRQTGNKGISLTKQFVLEYSVPTEYRLEQNYPNPFNPVTKIRYSVPQNTGSKMQNIELIIYDILGNKVTTLVNEQKKTGYYEVEFNASQFASGVYIYRLQANDFIATKKMLLIK